MIYNKNILTREDILNISDIGQLNKLIGEYTSEANRRVRNLTRYKGVAHRKDALKRATEFAGGMARLPGARLEDITFSSPSPYSDVIKARRVLGNLASYIRSPYSTIAGAGKELNRIKMARLRGAKQSINELLGRRAVTIKSLMGLSKEDWDNLRDYMDQFYGILDSGEVLDTYVFKSDKENLEEILEGKANKRRTQKGNLNMPEWGASL